MSPCTLSIADVPVVESMLLVCARVRMFVAARRFACKCVGLIRCKILSATGMLWPVGDERGDFSTFVLVLSNRFSRSLPVVPVGVFVPKAVKAGAVDPVPALSWRGGDFNTMDGSFSS